MTRIHPASDANASRRTVSLRTRVGAIVVAGCMLLGAACAAHAHDHDAAYAKACSACHHISNSTAAVQPAQHVIPPAPAGWIFTAIATAVPAIALPHQRSRGPPAR